MTIDEVRKVLSILKAAYPNTFKNLSNSELNNIKMLYFEMLTEYPVEVVVVALKNYIKSNINPPTIAGLVTEIEKIIPNSNDPVALWQTLSNAARNASSFSKEDFERLPIPIKKWLGNISQLKELGRINADIFETVTKGQFLKSIGNIIAREKALDELPQGLKDLYHNQYKQLGGQVDE